MRSFNLLDAVATTAMNAPSRSASAKGRNSNSICPSRAHSCTASAASIAITRTRAPVSSSPPILGSPTLPAPTTRHFLPANFKNIGNKLSTVRPPRRSARAPREHREQQHPPVHPPDIPAAPRRYDEQRTAAGSLPAHALPDIAAAIAQL